MPGELNIKVDIAGIGPVFAKLIPDASGNCHRAQSLEARLPRGCAPRAGARLRFGRNVFTIERVSGLDAARPCERYAVCHCTRVGKSPEPVLISSRQAPALKLERREGDE